MVTRICSLFKLTVSAASVSGRPKKIPDVEALTFALYQHRSTRATKKSVYEDFTNMLACSYKTFVVSVNRVARLSLQFLLVLMRLGKRHAHLGKYTDATDIPVGLKKNADSHRTMRGLAGFGRSSKGWYGGLKMTLTRDHDGRMLALRFTFPKANGRDIFRQINADIDGIIVADAGYVSGQLERDMNIENRRWLLIRPYKTMKKLAAIWPLKRYAGRFRIAFDFRGLKMSHGLVTRLPRSVSGYLANYLHALIAFA